MFTSVAASWQNLPADVLLLIAERSEIRLLRAVCSSWRFSLPLSYKAHHPLRSAKIPLPLFYQDPLRHHLGKYDNPKTLTERNIYCLERLDSPKSCWIVKLEETSSGKMRLYNPLSYRSYQASNINLPAIVDLLDYRVILVGKEYNLESVFKVVLSDDAMLCLFYDLKVGYLKFGDERWTMIVNEGNDEISYFTKDIIYHKQKFYVIDTHGQIIVFDSSLKVEMFASPVGYEEPYGGDWFFVHADGDLFVVVKLRYRVSGHVDCVFGPKKLVRFKVYRLNSDEQQWNEVTNLGDQSFFIGRRGNDCTSFSITSGHFSGCGKNFIYYADSNFLIIRKRGSFKPGNDMGIFSLEDNSSRPLHKINRYSRLFCPIPSWAKLRNAGFRRFLFK